MTKSTTNATFSAPRKFWSEHREASLNWLALGLLLAAWNASDNDASETVVKRPDSLRGYSCVSVRAAQRSAAINRMALSGRGGCSPRAYSERS
jgi:hypothetical protein